MLAFLPNVHIPTHAALLAQEVDEQPARPPLRLYPFADEAKMRTDVVGISSNAPVMGRFDQEALAYAVKRSNHDRHRYKHQRAVATHNLVRRLPKFMPQSGPNPQQTAVEIVKHQETPYYQDGSRNMFKAKEVCRMFVKMSCYSNPRCGWCGSAHRCVAGTPQGPQQQCNGHQVQSN